MHACTYQCIYALQGCTSAYKWIHVSIYIRRLYVCILLCWERKCIQRQTGKNRREGIHGESVRAHGLGRDTVGAIPENEETEPTRSS
jgi:hypothetical protein